jgi:cytochrome c556
MNFPRSMLMIRGTALLALANIWGLTAGKVEVAVAEESPSPQVVIETRRGIFKKMGAGMKLIVAQLKTDAPDSARMAAAAQFISLHAEEIPHWFPAGSGKEAGIETDALPYIWKDRAKFDSIANQLVPESKRLVDVIAGNDIDTTRAQVKVVGDVCGACHKSFRAD